MLFGSDDERALALAGDVLEDQVEDVLDVWYDFVASHPHLVAYFSTPEGEPLDDYLARVRRRFGQWILDTCRHPYDRAWLDYQEEIALRHTRTKKNQTDNAPSVAHIPLRYMVAFVSTPRSGLSTFSEPLLPARTPRPSRRRAMVFRPLALEEGRMQGFSVRGLALPERGTQDSNLAPVLETGAFRTR